jgi:hypothetical protein
VKKLLSIAILALFFISCEQTQSVDQNNQVDENQLIKEHLMNNGFSVRSIEFDGDLVILGKDAAFNRQDLLNDIKNPVASKQYSTNYIVSQSRVSDLKIFINSKVTSTWKTAVRSAIGDWNSINNTKLYMREVTSSTSADITFVMGRLTYGAIAQATFPFSDGRAGNKITISKTNYGLTSSQMRFAMVHEMGHCLGFRHTNWFDRNSDGNATTNDNEGVSTIGANHIPGTPSGLDPNSVMNAYVASWTDFSNYDKIAVQYLYP